MNILFIDNIPLFSFLSKEEQSLYIRKLKILRFVYRVINFSSHTIFAVESISFLFPIMFEDTLLFDGKRLIKMGIVDYGNMVRNTFSSAFLLLAPYEPIDIILRPNLGSPAVQDF